MGLAGFRPRTRPQHGRESIPISVRPLAVILPTFRNLESRLCARESVEEALEANDQPNMRRSTREIVNNERTRTQGIQMDRLIIYFHGFGSSTNSDKVDRLRIGVPTALVLAFPIDPNPSISLPFLTQQIKESIRGLQGKMPKIVFVGTSLGAWFASVLAGQFSVPAVLVNPSYEPKNSLRKYGLPENALNHYSDLPWNPAFDYFVSLDDEVINFNSILDKLNTIPKMYLYKHVSHRFNGPEFDDVIAKINELIE